MKNRYTVTLESPDREFDVVTDGRDVRKWEAINGESYIVGDTSLTQVTQVVHLAAVRTGNFDGSWDAFDAVCVEVARKRLDPTKPATEADTRSEATASTSAPSPSDSAFSPPSSSKKGKK